MKDIITVAVVNFRVDAADKASNLSRMCGFTEAAAKRGADGVSAAAVLRPNGGRDSYQATESGHPQRQKPLCLRRAAGQAAASGISCKEKSGSADGAPDS